MVAAEKIWLGRWQGISATKMLSAKDVPTSIDVCYAWTHSEQGIKIFIAYCDELRLNENSTDTNTRGQSYTMPFAALMYHVVDHETHHRGELVAVLTTLEVQHPDDGLFGYLIDQPSRPAQIKSISMKQSFYSVSV